MIVKKAALIEGVGDVKLFEKGQLQVKYTGRMRALAVSDEAQKALGLKPGMYFYPDRYMSLSSAGESTGQFLSRTFLKEERYKELVDQGVVVPPTCDIHYESVAYVCR